MRVARTTDEAMSVTPIGARFDGGLSQRLFKLEAVEVPAVTICTEYEIPLNGKRGTPDRSGAVCGKMTTAAQLFHEAQTSQEWVDARRKTLAYFALRSLPRFPDLHGHAAAGQHRGDRRPRWPTPDDNYARHPQEGHRPL